MIPLGQECHFPFLYRGKNVSECIRHEDDLKWCAYTYDSENGKKGGKCSKGNFPLHVSKLSEFSVRKPFL